MDELLEQFLIEGRDLVADAHRALGVLASDAVDVPALDALFRAAHTLKGSVALFDMGPAEALLHAAETRLAGARKGAALDGGAIEALVATIDQVDRWIDAMEKDGALPASAAALAEQLGAAFAETSETAAREAEDHPWLATLRARPQFAGRMPAQGGTGFHYRPDPDCFFRGEDPLALVATVPDLIAFALLPADGWPSLDRLDPFRCITIIEGVSAADMEAVRSAFRLVPDQVQLASLGPAMDAANSGADAQATTLRVEGEKLDQLARQAGELTVAVHGLHGIAERVERIDREMATDIRRAEAAIGQASLRIRASISDIRLVSLAPVLRRLPRLARELAAALDKDITFTLTGDASEADKQIADALFEPLLHLVRNAIDHGIESAAERAAAGKPSQGSVALAIRIEGDRLVATLRDDGRGIDSDRVRDSAVGNGLIAADAAAELSDAQAQRLIFMPGFSTAASVSAVSGRGVGMDAVLRTLERLQGSIEIESVPGEGTIFRISLPTNAITTRLLTVSAGQTLYGVRLDQIVETFRVEADSIHALGQGEACVVRGRTVPVLDLGSLLGAAGRRNGAARLIITEVTGEPVALRVDALGERLDTLVRERAGLLASVPAIAGTSVLSDGGVLLVLDLAELLA